MYISTLSLYKNRNDQYHVIFENMHVNIHIPKLWWKFEICYCKC